MDAGYDYEPIYKQVREAKAHAIIAYNHRREPELMGFYEYFASTCVREHSTRYESYDPKYENALIRLVYGFVTMHYEIESTSIFKLIAATL